MRRWSSPGLCGLVLLAIGCVAPGAVFPPDVQRAFNREEMRRAETEHLVIYYPAKRRAEVERFAARADRCAGLLKEQALKRGASWREKMTITMPEVAFNNAYVSPKFGGSRDVSVIPTLSTLDFTTEFGLPPDPGFIACHELTHYVQSQQISGVWATLNKVGGELYTPQAGFDPWFFEGLATHYEAALQPGVGRPIWPIFTGMFAAGYAGESISGGDLSTLKRLAPVGNHYLVGTMFVKFLVERYGEAALWRSISSQAEAWTGLVPASSIRDGFGKSLGTLLDEFDAWHYQRFPVRQRPAAQRRLAPIGNDARYARGRDGSEAWIADDLEVPTRLVVRGPDGNVRAELAIGEVLPPRRLAQSSPLLTSGLSLTADGQQVWFTAVDLDSVAQTTRLMRWTAAGGLEELASGLGPGATIDATGSRYYFLEVDGDRWSMAVYDVASRQRRTLLDAAPGTYVLGAQLSPDGTTLAASAWNGAAFTIWLLDAASGALRNELVGEGPLFDPAFLDDGRLVNLASVDGRFQVQLRELDGSQPAIITDAPYAVLAPRGSGQRLRFLNREGWRWTLDEIAVPPPAPLRPPGDAVDLTGPKVNSCSGSEGDAGADSCAKPEPGSGSGSGSGSIPKPLSSSAPRSEAGATASPAAFATSSFSASFAATAATAPSAPPALSATASPPPAASLLTGDRRYSVWDSFFRPTLIAPTVVAAVDGDSHLGLNIGGGDVLGMHRWMLAGLIQNQSDVDNDDIYLGGVVSYANAMLAPWTITAEASSFRGIESDDNEDDVEVLSDRRVRDVRLVVGRSWRASWSLVAAMIYTDDRIRVPEGLDPEKPPPEPDFRQLGGPALSLAYAGGEATPYTGLRRAITASFDVMHFPERLSSLERSATSLRTSLGLVTPLPFGRRHRLSFDAVARGVFRPADLLELGGTSPFTSLWSRSSSEAPPDPTFPTPPHLRLLEPLRGYEDITLPVSRLVAGELAWSYPLIIDRGVASTPLALPSSFLQQLELELFAAGAATDDRGEDVPTYHLATGGALTVRIELLRVPLSLRYQIARRLRDDRALTQFVGIAAQL